MEWPSVAKQLSECLGVTRKTNKAMDVTVDLTFASWDGTVGAHAVEHFNAERWVGVRRDAPGKVLKERRSPRQRGRMGTSV